MTRIALLLLLAVPAVVLSAPVPKGEKGENKLYVTIDGRVVKMNPDGTGQEKLFDDEHAGSDICVSPDGKSVLSRRAVEQPSESLFAVRTAGGKPVELHRASHHSYLTWAAGGESLYLCEEDTEMRKKRQPTSERFYKHAAIEAANARRTELDVPPEYTLKRPSADGKRLYFTRPRGEQRLSPNHVAIRYETVVSDASEFEAKVVIPAELNVSPVTVSQSGERWVVRKLHGNHVGTFEVGGKAVAFWEEERWIGAVAISPNGKRVAYVTMDDTGERRGKDVHLLQTADWNGENPTTVLRAEASINGIDWR